MLVGFVGVGVALVLVAGVLGLGVTLLAYRSGAVASLRAPVVVLALGAELIAAALLVGWRVGARVPAEEEDDGHGPAAG